MQVKSTESKVFLFDNTNVLECQICLSLLQIIRETLGNGLQVFSSEVQLSCALACCKAGLSSNLGSAPQGGAVKKIWRRASANVMSE